MLYLVAQSCPTLCDSMDFSPLGSSVHGDFSRQEYWSGLPCFLPGDLPTQGFNPGLLHCRQILFCLSHGGSPTSFYSKLFLEIRASQVALVVKKKKTKKPTCQHRRHMRCGFHPSVRKIPEGGHGNPLQYFCLENPMTEEQASYRP